MEQLSNEDVNNHLSVENLNTGELLTEISDKPVDINAEKLGVGKKKLVQANRSKTKYLRTVIFVTDKEHLTKINLGEELYNQLKIEGKNSLQIKLESEDEDNTEADVEDLSEEVKSHSNMAELSNFRGEFLLPIWVQNKASGLEAFINQLRSVKTLRVFTEDASLIYATLIKNKSIDIYQCLNTGQRADLEDFITHMVTTYVQSEVTKRMQFETISKATGEVHHMLHLLVHSMELLSQIIDLL